MDSSVSFLSLHNHQPLLPTTQHSDSPLMDSSFALSSTFTSFHSSKHSILLPSNSPFSLSSKTPLKPFLKLSISSNFSSNFNTNPSNRSNKENPFVKTLQSVDKTLILAVATSLVASKFSRKPIKVEPLTPTIEESTFEEQKVDDFSENESGSQEKTPLSHLMESNPEFVENLWKLLGKKN